MNGRDKAYYRPNTEQTEKIFSLTKRYSFFVLLHIPFHSCICCFNYKCCTVHSALLGKLIYTSFCRASIVFLCSSSHNHNGSELSHSFVCQKNAKSSRPAATKLINYSMFHFTVYLFATIAQGWIIFSEDFVLALMWIRSENKTDNAGKSGCMFIFAIITLSATEFTLGSDLKVSSNSIFNKS